MTTTLNANQRRTELVPTHSELTVTASASGSGTITRLGDHPGDASQGVTSIAAGETKIIGPFGVPTYHEIVAAESSLSYDIAPTDFEASDETAKGAIASYVKTDAGTKTLLAAAREDRVVQIVVHVTTVFANGDGAQPTLEVGETGTTTKFAASSVFTNAAAASRTVLIGTLSANKALILTQVAGTGTTETGAYTVSAIAAPLA